MAEIIPFRAVLYNNAKVGDLNKVMAPPYDVISPKLQDELYARHQNNVVRLILSKIEPADSQGSDRYSRAAADLEKWLNDGVLVRDEKPSIYYYKQTYTLKTGKTQTRKGFIALTRLVDFGKGIHPHEKTLSGPKADRLRLMQAADANMSCIFSLYSEPSLGINKTLDAAINDISADIDVKDDDGIANTLWRVSDPAAVSAVTGALGDKSLFIADGHHRYETALNYRNQMMDKNPNHTGNEPYNFVLMYFSNMDDEGMTIWPTHRVVHSLNNFNETAFFDRCAEYFDIKKFPFTEADEEAKRKAFLETLEKAGKETVAIGVKTRAKDEYSVLTLKNAGIMDKVFGDQIPDVFKALDVTVLHSLVLSRILGITQEAQEKQQNLVYVKSSEEAISASGRDANQLAFLLNPTRIEQVKSVALAGFVMPQKSTYFYPKLLSGLVLNVQGNTEASAAKV